MFILLILQVYAQSTTYLEYITVQPNYYFQFAEVVGPYQLEAFDAGTLYVTNNISVNTEVSQNTNFSMIVFALNNSGKYNCALNLLQYQIYVSDFQPIFSSCNITESCIIENQQVQLPESYCFSNYSGNSSENYYFDFYNESLDSKSTVQYMILFVNYKETPLSLLSVYSIDVMERKSFYEVSLVLCVVLGICVLALISVLCIMNYKYQQVREYNLTLKLVRGQSDSNYKYK